MFQQNSSTTVLLLHKHSAHSPVPRRHRLRGVGRRKPEEGGLRKEEEGKGKSSSLPTQKALSWKERLQCVF
eukprot:scaffold3037_cov142-Skeletonema_marinoi.AAC.6